MVDDPIVNEVRKIRDHLASESNYNLHTYFEMLRMEDSKRAEEKSNVISSNTQCAAKVVTENNNQIPRA